mmetsp:Transcript_43994/g.88765  ORF Transcript_43994/g.88765 Transcript_43994/m.88765 type:complete len:490 (+) Transcript_43994:224-1693(+)
MRQAKGETSRERVMQPVYRSEDATTTTAATLWPRHEFKVRAEVGILLQVILAWMVCRPVDQLEPCIGEVRIELCVVVGVFGGDPPVGLVRRERQVGRQTPRVSILALPVGRLPLVGAERALDRLPVLPERRIEEIVVPPRRGSRPRALEARRNCVRTQPGQRASATSPVSWTSTRLWNSLEVGALLGVGLAGPSCAGQIAVPVRPPQGVTATDQDDGLLVRPAHPVLEGVPHLQGAEPGGAVVHPPRVELRARALQLRALGEHVDQAHGVARLHPEVGLREVAHEVVGLVLFRPAEVVLAGGIGLALAGLAGVRSFDSELNRPLPGGVIRTSEAELLRRTSACFDAHGASEGDQVTPGHLVTELVLDLTEEAAPLVQIHVISPLVLRPMPLARTFTSSASVAAIHQPECSGTMPRESFEQTCIAGKVAILRPICWPAALRVLHEIHNRVVQLLDVQGLQLSVVALLAQGFMPSPWSHTTCASQLFAHVN